MHFDRLSSAPVGQLIAATAVGLLIAPSVLAHDVQSQAPGWQELAWLTLAVLVVAWLVALFPALGRQLGRHLERLSIPSAPARADLPLLSRLALAAGYVLLIQAILRRPLVLVLGPTLERFVVEATFAAAMLLVVFGLLVALHRAGRPLVSALAWLALDTAFATSGSAAPLAAPIRHGNHAAKPAATIRPATSSTGPAETTRPAAQPTQPATDPTLGATEPRLATTRPTLAATDADAVTADGQQTVAAS
jgi:hypothetical protein